MAVKLYQKLKQDLTQMAAWVRGQYAKKDEVKIFVGTCGTAAGTAAKVVSVDAFPTVSSGGPGLPGVIPSIPPWSTAVRLRAVRSIS